MELKDIRPRTGSFKLEATGEKVHSLRKFTLDDHIWLETEVGKTIEQIVELPPNQSIAILARIAYLLLEDKSDFIAKEVTLVDEEGVEKKDFLGGLKLFRTCIVGPVEQNAVIKAIGDTLGASNPKPSDKKKQAKPKE